MRPREIGCPYRSLAFGVVSENPDANPAEFQWIIGVFNDTKPPDESALTHELHHLSSFPFGVSEVLVSPTLPISKFFLGVWQLAEFLFGFLRRDNVLFVLIHDISPL
jgi:hypothetical protein